MQHADTQHIAKSSLSCCKKLSFTLQKTVFHAPKGGLSVMHGIAYIYKKFGGYRHFAQKKFGGRRNYGHLCVKYTKDYRRENGINYLPVYMTMLL